MNLKNYFRDKPTFAYLMLVICLALHVTGVAIHHFLDFYNPAALKIREYLIFFPPTFSFKICITGLCLAILLLLLLAPFVYSRNRRMIPAATIFAVIMILNGLGHIAGSIYIRQNHGRNGNFSFPDFLFGLVDLPNSKKATILILTSLPDGED